MKTKKPTAKSAKKTRRTTSASKNVDLAPRKDPKGGPATQGRGLFVLSTGASGPP